jgi:hypothetical protein
MGESNMDDIDRRIVEDDRFPSGDTHVATSQGQEEQPFGKLAEAYALLGKGLPIPQIAVELRMRESELRWLLRMRKNQ